MYIYIYIDYILYTQRSGGLLGALAVSRYRSIVWVALGATPNVYRPSLQGSFFELRMKHV